MSLVDTEDIFLEDLSTDTNVLYKVQLASLLGEPVVSVSFLGFDDEEHAEDFAKYMLAFLELNKVGSPSGLIN
jgi:hypothetical protein